MPTKTSELQPDEKHQIDSARGAILGVYLFALVVCLGRVSDRILGPCRYEAGGGASAALLTSAICLFFFLEKQLYVRKFILHAFQIDDWACITGLVSTTGFAALSLAVIEFGAGRHLVNIPFDDARIFYIV